MLALNRWGPSCWHFLHAVAHTAPSRLSDDEVEQKKAFLRSVCDNLPCPRCRAHSTAFLDERLTDESVATKEALVSFLNELHNSVNERTGKRAFTLREHYEAMARPPPPGGGGCSLGRRDASDAPLCPTGMQVE